MRVLIVAPDQPGLNAIPEARQIQEWHDCAILYGTVTGADVFRACQERPYDVIHFATHGGPDGVLLSNGALLSPEDIAQAARLRETRGVFFNACQTGRPASYVVRHGVQWAISSEVDLPDDAAWKLAAAFYNHQRGGEAKSFVGAYKLADSGDGEYALHIAPDYVLELQKAAAAAATIPHAVTLTRRQVLVWGAWLLGLSLAASVATALLAGRF